VANGQARWVWRLGRLASDTSAPRFRSGAAGVAISGDTVFATLWHFTNLRGGTSEGVLVALDRTTGREFWNVTLPERTGGTTVWAAPLLTSDLAIVTTLGGTLYAVRRDTGLVAWTYHSSGMYLTLAQPALVNNTIYTTLSAEK